MPYSLDYKTYDRSKLPDDPAVLKDIIGELVYTVHLLQEKIAELVGICGEFKQRCSELEEKVTHLEHQLGLMKQKQFGRKSEKVSVDKTLSVLKTSEEKPFRKKHVGRQKLPHPLKRVRTEYDLKEEEKVCPLCRGIMVKIQDVTTEQLDIVPAQLQVKEHVRSKYACRHCYGSVRTAPLPAQVIDKGRASAALLAHLLVNKFYDHFPFYRQQKWFERQGYDVSRTTLWSWEEQCAIALEPLVKAMKDELTSGDHVFSDDTPMPTLEKGLGKTKTRRMWTYTRRGTSHQKALTVYEYTPDRQGLHPQIFLKNFKGYLQVDAYSGFKQLFAAAKGSLCLTIEVGCWGHARRKFVEVASLDPVSLSWEILKMIQQLYAVERVARDHALTDQQRKWLRRHRSRPILKKIYQWLKKHQPRAPPKSALGQAIFYALNHWQALTVFLTDGRLEIDNNRAERSIKSVVIGRKNFLFMGGSRGGWAAAIVFSLMETCRQNKIDPQAYLTDVLERLPTHPYPRLKELLPHYWKSNQNLDQAA